MANDVEAEQLVDAGIDRRTGMPQLASIVQVCCSSHLRVPSVTVTVTITVTVALLCWPWSKPNLYVECHILVCQRLKAVMQGVQTLLWHQAHLCMRLQELSVTLSEMCKLQVNCKACMALTGHCQRLSASSCSFSEVGVEG